jgi:3-dehydroquinate dehydratase/shikimate dehydrogenase
VNNGKICISVCAETSADLIDQIRRAEPLADVIELRFDCLHAKYLIDAPNVIRAANVSKPLIATLRSPHQGGKRDLTPGQRADFWRCLGPAFEFVDIEEDISPDLDDKRHILSFHDHSGTPADLAGVYHRLATTAPEVVKIATTATDITDAIPLWQVLEKARLTGREIIPIAMGDAGKWTRILGLAHGAFLTYASLDAGKETADGQVTASDLIDVYRVKDLDRDTQVYGVIGDPVSASLSPYMHNAAFADVGLNAVFMPLKVKDLDAFIRRMVMSATRELELNFAGFSVTMPHKQAIMPHLTDIDAVAAKIGAVNTVKINGERLIGYNTDAPGFIASLKGHFPDLKGARVAVLGAGGAARAVVYALQAEGADVTIFARDPEKAGAFASEFNVGIADLATINDQRSTIDVLVNATPFGMRGPNAEKTPLTSDELAGVRFVYDLVTRRDETPLIREARLAGIPAIGGVEMLIVQGLRQFEIWTGQDAPADIMRQAVMARLG